MSFLHSVLFPFPETAAPLDRGKFINQREFHSARKTTVDVLMKQINQCKTLTSGWDQSQSKELWASGINISMIQKGPKAPKEISKGEESLKLKIQKKTQQQRCFKADKCKCYPMNFVNIV